MNGKKQNGPKSVWIAPLCCTKKTASKWGVIAGRKWAKSACLFRPHRRPPPRGDRCAGTPLGPLIKSQREEPKRRQMQRCVLQLSPGCVRSDCYYFCCFSLTTDAFHPRAHRRLKNSTGGEASPSAAGCLPACLPHMHRLVDSRPDYRKQLLLPRRLLLGHEAGS